jgi:alkanesulfonate monooxygenase SsuD/methylene tetrahydromethanopterin reductase-like flavin-dependent oxidoreductase (luciferase family)
MMDAFVERMAARIADGVERWAAGPEEVRALIREEIERAARHGVAAEGDVARYLGLLCALGPAFDERVAWARAILGRDDLDAERKLNRLERRARRRPSEAKSA